jgi:hypothetical protein
MCPYRALYITFIKPDEIRLTLVGSKHGDITKTVHTWDKVEEVSRNWIMKGVEVQ